MTRINDLIQQLHGLLRKVPNVFFDTPEYVIFKINLENYIYENHCNNTSMWGNISQTLIYKSNQYLTRKEADFILINLEELKRYIMAKENDPLLSFLHPKIARVSQKLYLEENYANAVEDAYKEIANRVRKLFKKIKTDEPPISDSSLMTTVFSDNNPLIEFCDRSTTTGENIQKGYMLILQGVMLALRNTQTHANNKIIKEECRDQLIMASHLMHKIDEAIGYSHIEE